MSDEPSRPPRVRKGCVFALYLALVFAFAPFVVPGDLVVILIELLFQLLLGWFRYLRNTLPKIDFNLEMILCGVGALVLAVWLAHGFIRWLRNSGGGDADLKPWPFTATLALTALLLLMFGAAIAMTGIIHQTGWLMRDKMVESSLRSKGMANKALQHAKQLYLAIHDRRQDTGRFPENLDELSMVFAFEKPAEFRVAFSGPIPNGDRWLYFPDAMGSRDVQKILLVSPAPIGGSWIVVFADGSGGTTRTLHGLDLPFHPAPALDPMPAAER